MDESFVEAAMRDHGSSVLRAAHAVTNSRTDAEDVFSDVFFALYRYGGGFVSDTHLKAWLLRVAVNKSKNIVKSAHNRRRAALTENIAAPEEDKTGGEVLDALTKLKPKSRAVVYLHYYEGYSLCEIGRLLSIKEGSVRSIAGRAREELKAFLSD